MVITYSGFAKEDEHTTPCYEANQTLLTKPELHQVYNSTTRSLMDYCSPVFVKLPKILMEKLEKVDKRAHRIIFGELKTDDWHCKQNNVEKRRLSASLKLFLKSVENRQYHLQKRFHPRTPTQNKSLSLALLPHSHVYSLLSALYVSKS